MNTQSQRILICSIIGIIVLAVGIYVTVNDLLPWKTFIFGFDVDIRIIAISVGILLAVIYGYFSKKK